VIDREQILHVARLARLSLSDDEIGKMAVELSAILGHVERISELDLEGVAPTTHVIEVSGALRPDVVVPSLDREQVLAGAPDRTEDGFRVPSPQA